MTDTETLVDRALVAKNIEIGSHLDALRNIVALGQEPIDHWDAEALRSMVRVMRGTAEIELKQWGW